MGMPAPEEEEFAGCGSDRRHAAIVRRLARRLFCPDDSVVTTQLSTRSGSRKRASRRGRDILDSGRRQERRRGARGLGGGMNISREGVETGARGAHERAIWLLLAALTGIAIYLCWRILQPFTSVILWAVVLALMFAPLYRRLLARTRRPNLAASVTLVVALVSVLLPLAGLSLAVVGEVGNLVDEAPGKWNEWISDPRLNARATAWRADLEARFPFVARIDGERVKASLNQLAETLVKRTFGLVGSVLQGVVELVFIVFSLFYLLRDSERFAAALRGLLPLSARQSDLLMARTVEVIHASVLGVIAVACLQGALGGAMFAILGLPSPILWGVVMAFFAMIPMIGAGAVWLPAAILLLVTGHAGKAIALCAVGALVIGTIDNILRPRLVGGRTGMHELVVFFAVLGGLKVFGLVGLLVGPAVFAVAWSLLVVFRESAQGGESGPLGAGPATK